MMESSTASESYSFFRIALANLRFPSSPEESLELAVEAIGKAGEAQAGIVCFPECYVPGYRKDATSGPPPDPAFLERALSETGSAAAKAGVAVVLGCERVAEISGKLLATTAVFQADGALDGFQDKVQIDPSEEGLYSPGSDRRVFRAGPLTFGVAICHEGWRYPETVRFAARRGAQVVFHPHYHWAEGPDSFRPATFADPRNSFHEKAALCRAAENTCYFATVNYASEGSPTTSAVVNPDGSLLCYQPYGVEGLLIADLDLRAATGLLASRFRIQ
jgi:predicted amidohydrolase